VLRICGRKRPGRATPLSLDAPGRRLRVNVLRGLGAGPASRSRRGTCGLSWPGRADVTGTGDGRHGREFRFAAMLDL